MPQERGDNRRSVSACTEPLRLTPPERELLETWADRVAGAGGIQTRCRVVLASASGRTDEQVADLLGVDEDEVVRVIARFRELRQLVI